MVNSLYYIEEHVFNRSCVHNLLWGLNKRYDYLRTWIIRFVPFSFFHKVHNDLILKKITKGGQLRLDTATALFSSSFGVHSSVWLPTLML